MLDKGCAPNAGPPFFESECLGMDRPISLLERAVRSALAARLSPVFQAMRPELELPPDELLVSQRLVDQYVQRLMTVPELVSLLAQPDGEARTASLLSAVAEGVGGQPTDAELAEAHAVFQRVMTQMSDLLEGEQGDSKPALGDELEVDLETTKVTTAFSNSSCATSESRAIC